MLLHPFPFLSFALTFVLSRPAIVNLVYNNSVVARQLCTHALVSLYINTISIHHSKSSQKVVEHFMRTCAIMLHLLTDDAMNILYDLNFCSVLCLSIRQNLEPSSSLEQSLVCVYHMSLEPKCAEQLVSYDLCRIISDAMEKEVAVVDLSNALEGSLKWMVLILINVAANCRRCRTLLQSLKR